MSTLMLYTILHTAICLVGLAYGVPAIWMLFRRFKGGMDWTVMFLVLAFLSTFTGFFFPFNGFTPALGTGLITSAIFGLMYVAYRKGLVGKWRGIFAGCMVAQVFFLAFVTIVQAFQKVPSLHVLAPTQSEPPFGIAQGINLVVFLVIGVLAVRKFQPYSLPATGKVKATATARRRVA